MKRWIELKVTLTKAAQKYGHIVITSSLLSSPVNASMEQCCSQATAETSLQKSQAASVDADFQACGVLMTIPLPWKD